MDILKFAIEMELDGEQYYNKQAIANQENGLSSVITLLAKEEANHASLLSDKSKGLVCKLNDQELSPKNNYSKTWAHFYSQRKKIRNRLMCTEKH